LKRKRWKTTTQRGYGQHHQALRKQWAPKVAAGVVDCARCHKRIRPGEPWDLGHVDGSRTEYAGPEHRGCNRAVVTHLKQAAAAPAAAAPDPYPPGNWVSRWSRHWYGGFNERCPDCRTLGHVCSASDPTQNGLTQ